MGLCTKCQAKPAVKNHMCEPCEVAHVEWLKEEFSGEVLVDDDGFYTVYESGGLKNDA